MLEVKTQTTPPEERRTRVFSDAQGKRKKLRDEKAHYSLLLSTQQKSGRRERPVSSWRDAECVPKQKGDAIQTKEVRLGTRRDPLSRTRLPSTTEAGT